MKLYDNDTIVALATATGRGGVAIIRLSGDDATSIAQTLTQRTLTPRYAHYCDFQLNDDILDSGVAIYFQGPHSFTGEDIVELQCHGGPVVVDRLIRACNSLGARNARPGEFSERAFLNDKIDLTQAEAIADLIDSATEAAARNAVRSLQGVFSSKVQALVESLIHLRIYVEAAIDFPEEEIDFLSDGKVATDLADIQHDVNDLLRQATQGQIMRDGMTVVIAGRPNAGKSSLLNALSGRESAIVTDIAGTTRDVLKEHVQIDGMPLHMIDTAGLRDTNDVVEKEGIKRALQEIQEADLLILLVDSSTDMDEDPVAMLRDLAPEMVLEKPRLLVYNKSDKSGLTAGHVQTENGESTIAVSAKRGDGMDIFCQALKDKMGYNPEIGGSFTARRRHLEALQEAQHFIDTGAEQLHSAAAGELLAEDLRQAQEALSSITGEFTSDDLLGRIFSSFCIGK